MLNWTRAIGRETDQTSRTAAVAIVTMALARRLDVDPVSLPRIGAAAMALDMAGWRPRSPKSREDAEAFLPYLRRVDGLDPLIVDLYLRAIGKAPRREKTGPTDADLALKAIWLGGDYLRLMCGAIRPARRRRHR